MTYEKQIEMYKPYILEDEKEPFPLLAIGVTVFEETKSSSSFKRVVEVDKEQVAYVIEYAFYWNYDSQHMYDLEHVWIYVGHEGDVVDCEASFHGKFLKSFKVDKSNRIDNHIVLYCQPGKHAFSPYSELFEILPDFVKATSLTTKDTGLHVNDIIKNRIDASEERQVLANKALAYFKFVPSRKYKMNTLASIQIMPWEALYDKIPDYLNEAFEQLETLK